MLKTDAIPLWGSTWKPYVNNEKVGRIDRITRHLSGIHKEYGGKDNWENANRRNKFL